MPYSCDVTLVGGSLAGIVAALEASRNGAKVIVIANDDSEGTESFAELGNGIIASGSGLQKDQGFEVTDGLLADFIYQYGEEKGSTDHQKIMAENSAAAVEWLRLEAGISFSLDRENPALHLIDSPAGLRGIIETLRVKAKSEGVIFFDSSSLRDIIRLDDYYAITVYYQDRERVINSRRVILADGGFLGNPTLVEAYAKNLQPASWRSGAPGEGINWAYSEGLDLRHMNSFIVYPSLYDRNLNRWVEVPAVKNGLLVSNGGIVPLENRRPAFWSREEVFKTGEKIFLVIEDFLWQEQILPGDVFSPVPGLTAFQERYELQIPYLQRWLHYPEETLWVAEVRLTAHYCLGGLRVNTDGAVKKNNQILEGMYAAGEITGGIYGSDAAPGAILLEAVVFGRLVGIHAARNAIL